MNVGVANRIRDTVSIKVLILHVHVYIHVHVCIRPITANESTQAHTLDDVWDMVSVLK